MLFYVIYALFDNTFISIIVYHRIMSMCYTVLCVCSMTLLFIHAIYNSLHLLTPTSHFTSPQAPPPWQPPPSLFSMPVTLFLFHRQVHLCPSLDSTYDWYSDICFSFWLISLSMIISSCIHVAANHIILFFFSQTHMAPCGWPMMVWSGVWEP